ncbi:response regulator [bacterium]|nr:response regulator [bacterium]
MRPDILLVDDSTAMRLFIKKALSTQGMEIGKCFQAGKGQEALELLGQEHVDIAFIDLNLPDIYGLEIIEFIRRQPKLQHVKIVIITSEAHQPRLQDFVEQGILLIQKPFTAEELYKQITEIVREDQ